MRTFPSVASRLRLSTTPVVGAMIGGTRIGGALVEFYWGPTRQLAEAYTSDVRASLEVKLWDQTDGDTAPMGALSEAESQSRRAGYWAIPGTADTGASASMREFPVISGTLVAPSAVLRATFRRSIAAVARQPLLDRLYKSCSEGVVLRLDADVLAPVGGYGDRRNPAAFITQALHQQVKEPWRP